MSASGLVADELQITTHFACIVKINSISLFVNMTMISFHLIGKYVFWKNTHFYSAQHEEVPDLIDAAFRLVQQLCRLEGLGIVPQCVTD